MPTQAHAFDGSRLRECPLRLDEVGSMH